MKKSYLFIFFSILSLLLFTLFNACKKDPDKSAKSSFTEEFDTVANLYNKNWAFINNSRPLGTASWQQGFFGNGKLGPEGFPAYSYHSSGDEYVLAGALAGSDIATISSWMLTPPVSMKNGDRISFYTRTDTAGSVYPDRLQVRINTTDESADVGSNATSVGKFTTLLLDINPAYAVGNSGYPTDWKQYTLILSGLNGTIKSRIAFRYFVENGGPNGNNSNSIGIDLLQLESL
jgi:hypothetical protein